MSEHRQLKQLKKLYSERNLSLVLEKAAPLKSSQARLIETAVYLETHNTIKAIASLNKIAPENYCEKYHLLRGIAFSKIGLLKNSTEQLSLVKKQSYELLTTRVENAIQSRDINLLEAILSDEDYSEHGYLHKLKIYSVLGDYESLLKHAELFTKKYPHSPSGWNYLSESRELLNEELEKVLAISKRARTTQEQVIFANVVGKALLKQKNYTAGTKKIVQASKLAANETPYDSSYQDRQFKSIRSLRVVNTIDATQILQPVFIVGMPRSGSTLLERRFLEAGYDSVGESLLISNLISLSLAMRGEIDCRFIRQAYIENIAYRGIRANFWVDKSLNNYKYMEIIKSIFPDAKFLLLNRDIKANFWSIYKTVFREGNLFSNDFRWINNEYKLMLRFISEQEVISASTVNYSDLISGKFQIKPVGESIDRPLSTASSNIVRHRILTNRDDEVRIVEPVLNSMGIKIS